MTSSDPTTPPDDSPDASDGPDIGEVLDGRYRIVEHLATGGFGHVHAAEDLEADRRVAIKILRTDSASRDPRAAARMRQEAEILRALDHPNLVTVYEVVTRSDADYMVMELLEGRTLDEVLEQEGPAGPERVRPVARQILSALGALHDREVNHRDIKPDNIVLIPDDAPNSEAGETAKLVDFGIAKAQEFLDDDHEEAGFTLVETRGDGFVGTPRYASPEQAVGDPTVPSSDLFSLGLVLIEWFTGQPVIDDSQQKGVISLLIQPDPIDTSDCPPDWRDWLSRMVAKTPQERFTTADQAIQALPGHAGDTDQDAYDPTVPVQTSDLSNPDGSSAPSDRSSNLPSEDPDAEADPNPPADASSNLSSSQTAAAPDSASADASSQLQSPEAPRSHSSPNSGAPFNSTNPADSPTRFSDPLADDSEDIDTMSVLLTVASAAFFLFAVWVFLNTIFR